MKKKETEGAKHSQSLSREKKTHEEEAEEGIEQSRGEEVVGVGMDMVVAVGCIGGDEERVVEGEEEDEDECEQESGCCIALALCSCWCLETKKKPYSIQFDCFKLFI